MLRFLIAVVGFIASCWVVAGVKPLVLPDTVLVRIAGDDVTAVEYDNVLNRKLRETFYHGDAPEVEQASVRREVLESLVEGHLLAAEALRRGLQADEGAIELMMRDVDRRNKMRPEWQGLRQTWAPIIRDSYRREALETLLKADVAAAQVTNRTERLAYYRQHPEKFTQPAQKDVSVIVFAVEASAEQSAWTEATETAEKVRQELLDGGDFSELAQIYSSDPSAADGGRMGAMHEGMLGETVESALAEMRPGDVSEPVVLLEGMVLLRLNSRVEPQVMLFDEVQARVAGLLKSELESLAWQALKFRLRSQAELYYNEDLMARMGIPVD